MADFHEVLVFLYERAKQRDGLHNQEDFARKHGISREHMNQFLTGNAIPPPKTIWEILEREGYALYDCIELPDSRNAREHHEDLFQDLETIVTSGDQDRIQGIGINLFDIAAGTRSKKKRKVRKRALYEAGNLASKKKQSSK